jgi:hypothetical protein
MNKMNSNINFDNSSNNSNICSFCNKSFSTKNTLLNHQKNTKYCLKKQGIINKKYKCSYCTKILTSQMRLNMHINICKEKDIKNIKILLEEKEKEKDIKILLEEKEKELKIYKELFYQAKNESLLKEKINEELRNLLEKANNTISDIAKQPKTINTTNTNSHNDNRIRTQNNTQSFDIDDIKKINNILENHLTPEVLAKGQRGVAEMLKEYLLKNENGELIYGCTDVSRQKFEFINKHGFIETDPKATKLISSLNNANIFDVAHTTGKKLWETEEGINHNAQYIHMPKVTEVLEINEDSSKLRSHLANITSR